MINIQIDVETVLHNIKPNAFGGQKLQNKWKEVAYICHHVATDVPEIRRINKLKDGLNSLTGKSSLVAIKHNGSSIEMGLKSPKNCWLIKVMSREGSHNMDLLHLSRFPHLLGILLQCVAKWFWLDSPWWLWGIWINQPATPTTSHNQTGTIKWFNAQYISPHAHVIKVKHQLSSFVDITTPCHALSEMPFGY